MDKTDVVIEVEDAAPTVEQVVAYERFWKILTERLLKEGETRRYELQNQTAEKLAA